VKAFVRDRYGPPDVLKLVDEPMPAIGRDGVLVRVLKRGRVYATAEVQPRASSSPCSWGRSCG
jgi:hypothetical protein